MLLKNLIYGLLITITGLFNRPTYAHLPCFAAPCQSPFNRAECTAHEPVTGRFITVAKPYTVTLQHVITVKGKPLQSTSTLKLDITDPQACWNTAQIISSQSIGKNYRFYVGKWTKNPFNRTVMVFAIEPVRQ